MVLKGDDVACHEGKRKQADENRDPPGSESRLRPVFGLDFRALTGRF